MTNCCCFDFTFDIETLDNFDFSFDEQEFDFSIGMCYSIVSGDIYMGTYEVIPKTIMQYLYTRDKTMKKNVTVYEIPYAETSNEYGTTVTIAS